MDKEQRNKFNKSSLLVRLTVPVLAFIGANILLAAIAGAFGAQQVSLHSVIQKRKVNNCSELVLITYRVSDANLRLAINTISGMSVVNNVRNVIRVEAGDM